MARILIVDDEKAIRKTMREILEYESYQIEEADNGVDALNLLREENFDAVLLDIKMPKMDGLEVLDIVLKEKIDVPVIMISGHATVDIAVDAVKQSSSK